MHGIIGGLAVMKWPQAVAMAGAGGGIAALLAQASFESTVFGQLISFGGIGVLAAVCLWLLLMNMKVAREEKRDAAEAFERERQRLLVINERQLDEIIAAREETAANRRMLQSLCDRLGVAKTDPAQQQADRPSRKAPRPPQPPPAPNP